MKPPYNPNKQQKSLKTSLENVRTFSKTQKTLFLWTWLKCKVKGKREKEKSALIITDIAEGIPSPPNDWRGPAQLTGFI